MNGAETVAKRDRNDSALRSPHWTAIDSATTSDVPWTGPSLQSVGCRASPSRLAGDRRGGPGEVEPDDASEVRRYPARGTRPDRARAPPSTQQDCWLPRDLDTCRVRSCRVRGRAGHQYGGSWSCPGARAPARNG